MKKVFSVLVALMMVATMSLNAAGRGKYIHVDATVNKNLKPQIAFYQDNVDGEPVTTILVKTVDVNDYKEFTDVSRVLLRFADGTAVRLNRTAKAVTRERKYSEKKGTATISFYPTVVEYEVTPEVIEKLEASIAIIKVRIVFKENESKDYDISEGYQARMAADLLKSYQEAVQTNRRSNSDLSDEDF